MSTPSSRIGVALATETDDGGDHRAVAVFLIPFSSATGMEIMKPIAAPSIGGMVTSTLHVLFMTPCLFVIQEDIRQFWRRRRALKKSGVEEHTIA